MNRSNSLIVLYPENLAPLPHPYTEIPAHIISPVKFKTTELSNVLTSEKKGNISK
jgi:hypothetical protein